MILEASSSRRALFCLWEVELSAGWGKGGEEVGREEEGGGGGRVPFVVEG